MFQKKALFLTALLCTFSLVAAVEEKKENQKEEPIKEYVVVTASAVRESEKDVVGSFSLVRRETIDLWKLVNLNEALDFSGPELTLVGGSYGQMNSTFIRGASSKHTLFMINNVRINDPAALSLDVSLISPQVFQQVEVVDGPQSSLYGSEAMGGVVNLIPQQKQGIGVSLWGGSASSLSAALDFGHRFSPHTNFNLSYSFFRTDGIQKNSDFLTHNVFGAWQFRRGPTELNPFLFFARSDTGIPFNMGLPSLLRRTQTSFLVAGVPASLRFSERLSMDLTLGYVTRKYSLRDPEDQWSPWYYTFSRNAQAQGRLVWGGIGSESPTIIGAEVTGAWIDEEDGSSKTFDNLTFHSYALWLEQVVNFKKFQGVFAVRGDKFSRFPGHVSPRLSFRYGIKFGDILTSVYAMGSGGFRAPKPSEYASPWGNPDLIPEKSLSLEAGLQAVHKNFGLKAGYFDTRYRDMIAFDYATYRLVNSEKDHISGWQVQPDIFAGNISINFSFLKLRAVNQDSGERLIRRPDHIFKLLVQGEWKKWSIGLFGRFVGGRKDYDEKSMRVVDAESFGVFYFTFGYRINQRFNMFLKVQNLFDRDYMEIFGYPAPGRSLYAGVDYKI